MTLVSNVTVSSVSRVLQRLQHSQPTMFCCSRLLNALPKKFQSNQPAIFLAAEFDGCLCERALDASTRFCKHVSTRLPKFCWILSLQLTLVTYVCWDRPRWSPSAMSAVALTHCAKIRGSIGKKLQTFETEKRDTESHKQRKSAYNSLVYKICYPLGKNSRPTSRGGRLELPPPPKRATPIYRSVPARHSP